jgi:DNA polymerase III alpha subunit
MTFVHLHTHSHFSLLEAVPQISDLVDKAKSYGYTALALTDTNNLYAAIEFQKECQKAGIKISPGQNYLLPKSLCMKKLTQLQTEFLEWFFYVKMKSAIKIW